MKDVILSQDKSDCSRAFFYEVSGSYSRRSFHHSFLPPSYTSPLHALDNLHSLAGGYPRWFCLHDHSLYPGVGCFLEGEIYYGTSPHCSFSQACLSDSTLMIVISSDYWTQEAILSLLDYISSSHDGNIPCDISGIHPFLLSAGNPRKFCEEDTSLGNDGILRSNLSTGLQATCVPGLDSRGSRGRFLYNIHSA